MEPSRRELKIPLRVLCLLSYKIESRGPTGLRAKLTINSYLRRCFQSAYVKSGADCSETPSVAPSADLPVGKRLRRCFQSAYVKSEVDCSETPSVASGATPPSKREAGDSTPSLRALAGAA